MAGYVNSWIEQYTERPTPCIQDTLGINTTAVNGQQTVEEPSLLSNCCLWLIVGFVFGSLRFKKRGER